MYKNKTNLLLWIFILSYLFNYQVRQSTAYIFSEI